jgi:hypothetical protein
MKRLIDRATTILWLLLAILAAVPRLNAETTVSRETQPRNRTRQMMEVAGGAIPILVVLRRKRKYRSQMIITVQVARPANSQAADERQ